MRCQIPRRSKMNMVLIPCRFALVQNRDSDDLSTPIVDDDVVVLEDAVVRVPKFFEAYV